MSTADFIFVIGFLASTVWLYAMVLYIVEHVREIRSRPSLRRSR